MYAVTILNHLREPMVRLRELAPILANRWYTLARETGYDCEVEYIGGAEDHPNHVIASDQDMKQYAAC
jgi:hypothetical protein